MGITYFLPVLSLPVRWWVFFSCEGMRLPLVEKMFSRWEVQLVGRGQQHTNYQPFKSLKCFQHVLRAKTCTHLPLTERMSSHWEVQLDCEKMPVTHKATTLEKSQMSAIFVSRFDNFNSLQIIESFHKFGIPSPPLFSSPLPSIHTHPSLNWSIFLNTLILGAIIPILLWII